MATIWTVFGHTVGSDNDDIAPTLFASRSAALLWCGEADASYAGDEADDFDGWDAEIDDSLGEGSKVWSMDDGSFRILQELFVQG